MPKRRNNAGKEPVFIIRPASKSLGLDYLHVSLIVLVAILVALAFALAYFRQGIVQQNCQYGIVNGTCATLKYNSTDALNAAERVLASYATANNTLNLLPYFSLVNRSRVSYLPNTGDWIVVIPYESPFIKGQIVNITIMLSGSNLTLEGTSLQTAGPPGHTNDSVGGLGFVSIYGKSLCNVTKPIPVYLFNDPYAPGAIASMYTALNISREFGGSIGMNYYFIFSGYATRYYNSYGEAQTQALGQYLYCASRQPARLGPFLDNLTKLYTGQPMSNYTLSQIEAGSGMNTTQFGSCMSDVAGSLDGQANLAVLYNVATTPEFITNCKYASIPQTVGYAINYSLKSIK